MPKLDRNHNSESVDDYLKAVLQLGGAAESPVTTNAIAERLKVRAPSVTGMLKKLASQRPALILHRKHQGVLLTAAGKRRAWELVRHHRLLELFLHDILKYPWDEVHDEAERLEHFISEQFEDRVAAILGDPEIDPHGHPIPQKSEPGRYREETPLPAWPVETPAVISSVSDHDPAALREIERLGLRPGIPLIIEQKNSAASITIQTCVRRDSIRLGNALASQILVMRRPPCPKIENGQNCGQSEQTCRLSAYRQSFLFSLFARQYARPPALSGGLGQSAIFVLPTHL